ncbi:MAG: hypothetical protein Q9223_007814 [Gallowayella weberi]
MLFDVIFFPEIVRSAIEEWGIRIAVLSGPQEDFLWSLPADQSLSWTATVRETGLHLERVVSLSIRLQIQKLPEDKGE